jgi:methionyl-tRNA formyltransferase
MKIAFFGLPIAALQLAADGHQLVLATLAPVSAPGRRRLAAALGDRVLDARELGSALAATVDERLPREAPELVSLFDAKLPERWIEAGRLGASFILALPRHRGPNPYY